MTTVKVQTEWTHTFPVLQWAAYDESTDGWTFYAMCGPDDGGAFHYPAHEDEDDAVEFDSFDRDDIVRDLGVMGTDWDELTPAERSRMIAWYNNDQTVVD